MSTAETREAILDAAWRLMREDADGVSMARIATAAGVSRQAVYLHFESWAGLLLALVRWIDERERFTERLAPVQAMTSPRARLEGYVTVWLNYLPRLHPVPGQLARARSGDAATLAWEDRMRALEGLYREPLRALHKAGALHPDLSVTRAVDAVRATASVHAWEHLVHDRGWSQTRAVKSLWRAARGAVCRDG